MWFPQLRHRHAFLGVRGSGRLLRVAFLLPSFPFVFFPDGAVRSMGYDIRVCRIHRHDDDIRPGVFQLEQTALLCGAQEGGQRLERGVLDVDGRGGCLREGARGEDVRRVQRCRGHRESGGREVGEGRFESLQERGP